MSRRFSERIEALPTWKRRLVNVAATVSAALVLIAALRPVVQPFAKNAITDTLDDTYVRLQSYEKDTLLQSVSHRQEVDSIFRLLRAGEQRDLRADSSLRCLRRNKPMWCE